MSPQPPAVTRRGFLKRTGGMPAAAAAFPYVVPGQVLGAGGAIAPGDRIALGVIGTGNQGHNDIRAFLNDDRVQIVAVCDVNRESAGYWNGAIGGREPARRLVEGHYAARLGKEKYKGCDAYFDFREVLARKDIDAVEVCTPDHWHAIPVIEEEIVGDAEAARMLSRPYRDPWKLPS